MKFWRASILPVLVTALMVLGFPPAALSAGAERVSMEALPAVSVHSTLPSADLPLSKKAATLAAEEDGEKPVVERKKRTRKCWRPEQRLLFATWVPVRTPGEGQWHPHGVRETVCCVPVSSEMLFISGGYQRLFQKG